jgi:hypothetical protein
MAPSTRLTLRHRSELGCKVKHRYSATIPERPFSIIYSTVFRLRVMLRGWLYFAVILYLFCGCFSSGSFSHIRKQVVCFFEDSNPLKHAGHTGTLLFVAPDRPTLYLPIWPAYAYTFLVGLFNTAVPPTEIMSHPLIYLCIYNLLNTLKTKIQRFRSYITENKMCFRWEDRLVYVVQENSRCCCQNHTKYIRGGT